MRHRANRTFWISKALCLALLTLALSPVVPLAADGPFVGSYDSSNYPRGAAIQGATYGNGSVPTIYSTPKVASVLVPTKGVNYKVLSLDIAVKPGDVLDATASYPDDPHNNLATRDFTVKIDGTVVGAYTKASSPDGVIVRGSYTVPSTWTSGATMQVGFYLYQTLVNGYTINAPQLVVLHYSS